MTDLRPIYVIANEALPLIAALPDSHMAKWAGLAGQGQALLSLNAITDEYGCDSGEYVVACFLGNITGWRGEDAKRIRTELKAHLATVQRRCR